MEFKELRQRVWQANRAIVEAGLVMLTWGNVSATDRKEGVFAIKPSGVDYDVFTPADVVVLSLESGERISGALKPSSDTPSHWTLYREFSSVGGVVHTHSTYATSWAQAGRDIPCMGTTHADHFHGDIPVTRDLTPEEIMEDYESNTGNLIMERFQKGEIDPRAMNAALVRSHGPFVWGATVEQAVENAIVLEEISKMTFLSQILRPTTGRISQDLLDKHFLRKHGPDSYYGQPGKDK